MDTISLAGAYQGLKAAKDILTTLFEAKVYAEAKPKILRHKESSVKYKMLYLF